MLIMPYGAESKSRNADFISIARRAIHNPRAKGPSTLTPQACPLFIQYFQQGPCFFYGELAGGAGFFSGGEGEGGAQAVPGDSGEDACGAHAYGDDGGVGEALAHPGGGVYEGGGVQGRLWHDGDFQDVRMEGVHIFQGVHDFHFRKGPFEFVIAHERGNLLGSGPGHEDFGVQHFVAVFNVDDVGPPGGEDEGDESYIVAAGGFMDAALAFGAEGGEERGVLEMGADDAEGFVQVCCGVEVFFVQKVVHPPFQHVGTLAFQSGAFPVQFFEGRGN